MILDVIPNPVLDFYPSRIQRSKRHRIPDPQHWDPDLGGPKTSGSGPQHWDPGVKKVPNPASGTLPFMNYNGFLLGLTQEYLFQFSRN
jgi:hypothetical protein